MILLCTVNKKETLFFHEYIFHHNTKPHKLKQLLFFLIFFFFSIFYYSNSSPALLPLPHNTTIPLQIFAVNFLSLKVVHFSLIAMIMTEHETAAAAANQLLHFFHIALQLMMMAAAAQNLLLIINKFHIHPILHHEFLILPIKPSINQPLKPYSHFLLLHLILPMAAASVGRRTTRFVPTENKHIITVISIFSIVILQIHVSLLILWKIRIVRWG